MTGLSTSLIALLLGAAAAFGFAPYGAWPLTLACLVALLVLLEQAATLRRAAALGWWFGVGHFCVGLNWIATAFTYQAAMPAWLGWIAVGLLSLYLAVFPAFAIAMGWWIAGRRPGALVLALSGCWIVGELLRASVFTGFAWNPLAAIWAPLWLVAGLTAYVGTYGLSGLTLLLAGGLLLAGRGLWRSFRSADRSQRRGRAFILIAMVAAIVTGAASILIPISRALPPPGTGPLLRVVQPNINQNEKWAAANETANFLRVARLTGRPGQVPRLILWPEVAIPWFLEDDRLARRVVAGRLGRHDLLLTGGESLTFDANGDPISATNSVYGVDPRGRLLGRYDKAHLVPYGEYLPMRPILSRLGLSRLAPGDIDFNPGPGARNIALPGIGPIGVQICYEIIFSGRVIDRAHRPRFLFNPSNDAWFGRWGPPQHLAQARLRAIEEGVPVVRSTPTGISAVIDAQGRLLAALPWRTAGAIELRLPKAEPQTPFARFGNILPFMLALALIAAGFASRRWSR